MIEQLREDGYPPDEYFTAVVDALTDAGIPIAYASREEPWEYVIELDPGAYRDGPLSWATHGLYVVWRADEDHDPASGDPLTGLGWYWLPYSNPNTSAGDFIGEFGLPLAASPNQVVDAVTDLMRIDYLLGEDK